MINQEVKRLLRTHGSLNLIEYAYCLVWLQSTEDTTCPLSGGHAVANPVSGHSEARLLQLGPGWFSSAAITPLQLIQNAAARLVFSPPRFSHITPLLRSLHWLPVAACIRFNTLVLDYKAKNGPAPPYLMAMVKSHSVPQALLSTARLDLPYLKMHPKMDDKHPDSSSSWLPDGGINSH